MLLGPINPFWQSKSAIRYLSQDTFYLQCTIIFSVVLRFWVLLAALFWRGRYKISCFLQPAPWILFNHLTLKGKKWVMCLFQRRFHFSLSHLCTGGLCTGCLLGEISFRVCRKPKILRLHFSKNKCLISKQFIFCSMQYSCIFHSTEVWGKILKPWGGFVRDMDCLNNTVQHRQWSLCIRLFSGDDYSSGDLPIDSLQCRMEV